MTPSLPLPLSDPAADALFQRVQIASLFVESILYGIFLISFVFAMRYLILDESGVKRRRDMHWYMVAVTMALFGLTTTDVCLGLIRVLRLDVHSPPNGIDTMLVIGVFIVIVLVDAILVYRCWIVYERSWKVILAPLVLWLGTTATVLFYIINTVALRIGVPTDSHAVSHALESILSLTIAQNILSTVLIAWRIWSIDRESARFRANRAERSYLEMITRIVIDSGLLCTLSALCSFISFFASKKGFAGYISSDAETQLISIAYNLIIIRTANHASEEYTFPHPCSTLELSQRGHVSGDRSLDVPSRSVNLSDSHLSDSVNPTTKQSYI